ncbi:hypothetical protein FIA58_002290 [Flavobacterium jejuense]|uniref:MerC mercury resistance protein n=1 Tax=Flavobacterium jejuense TaxID=1544455 RepID=A0ABX0IPU9_9FLAO|nr:hypothetical protein [Flavobacterium jejuense]NHN24493.1 hypothetical protein [Flavobacterium jejuense]
MESTKKSECTCNSSTCPNQEQEEPQVFKKSFKTIPSIALSFLIAFFPKCPICWAVYMSMLGSFGIAEIPYMKWLLPVFIVFLGIHLVLLLKKIPTKGYGPFVISLIGFGIMIPSKIVFSTPEWVSILGMSFIVMGSLWNSFTLSKKQLLIKI